ncbi:MAG: CapA family protein [Marinobacter sp.]|uniref:CapA family protein n=1 Tax=Marinobacter sp. TaxID=50741 RepID=UPI00299DD14B|nr:CapA family protein [Marinobacter sp.]MDX1755067.1 CapA family protein [Marinobacter sp.]
MIGKDIDRNTHQSRGSVRLFLCGDVMTGRGIDQILPHPSSPELFESYMKSALGYVHLAESASGPISRPVDWAYIWGEALPALDASVVHLRLINLETAITHSDSPWPGKAVNYRMNPANIDSLKVASITACNLANNHVLDWGEQGLLQTLETLDSARIAHTGAGKNGTEAGRPAVIDLAGGDQRLLLFGFGMPSSGVGHAWAAGEDRPGVNFLASLDDAGFRRVYDAMAQFRVPGDLVIVSVHWGPNWGFDIDPAARDFAHRLIDSGAADLVHGHSSHHIKPLEIYRNKLILYGCGDFLNDYEGIGELEGFRPDLALMYLPTLALQTGELEALELKPFLIRRLSLAKATMKDSAWVRNILCQGDRSNAPSLTVAPDGSLHLETQH